MSDYYLSSVNITAEQFVDRDKPPTGLKFGIPDHYFASESFFYVETKFGFLKAEVGCWICTDEWGNRSIYEPEMFKQMFLNDGKIDSKVEYYCKRIATVAYQLDVDTAIQLSNGYVRYCEKGEWICKEGKESFVVPHDHFRKAYRLIGESLKDVHLAGWRLFREIED